MTHNLQNPAYPSPITHQPPLIIFRCVLASLELRHFGHCVDFAPVPPTTKIQFFFKLIPPHSTLKTYESFATDLNLYQPINFMKMFSSFAGWHLPLSILNILFIKSLGKHDDK